MQPTNPKSLIKTAAATIIIALTTQDAQAQTQEHLLTSKYIIGIKIETPQEGLKSVLINLPNESNEISIICTKKQPTKAQKITTNTPNKGLKTSCKTKSTSTTILIGFNEYENLNPSLYIFKNYSLIHHLKSLMKLETPPEPSLILETNGGEKIDLVKTHVEIYIKHGECTPKMRTKLICSNEVYRRTALIHYKPKQKTAK